MVNVLPAPYSDCTSIFPSMAFTSLLVMTRPRPVPSTPLWAAKSTCVNSPNSFSKSSDLMPFPVSVTSMVKRTVSSVISPLTEKDTKPFLVYFTALLNMLSSTCLILVSSPIREFGTLQSIFTTKLRFESTTRILIMLTTSFTRDENKYLLGTISSFPLSIFEKSKMSFIMDKRFVPACLIVIICSRAASGKFSRNASSAMPFIAFIGVLISWLIFARNPLFAFEAASAFSAKFIVSSTSSINFC